MLVCKQESVLAAWRTGSGHLLHGHRILGFSQETHARESSPGASSVSFGLVIALGLTSVLAKARKKQVMELTDVKKNGFLFSHAPLVCLLQCGGKTSSLPSLPIPVLVDVEAASEFCRQEICGYHAFSTRLLGWLIQEGQEASIWAKGVRESSLTRLSGPIKGNFGNPVNETTNTSMKKTEQW